MIESWTVFAAIQFSIILFEKNNKIEVIAA